MQARFKAYSSLALLLAAGRLLFGGGATPGMPREQQQPPPQPQTHATQATPTAAAQHDAMSVKGSCAPGLRVCCQGGHPL